MGFEHVQLIALYKVLAKIYATFPGDATTLYTTNLRTLCTDHVVYLEHIALHSGVASSKTGIQNDWYSAFFVQKGENVSVYHTYRMQIPHAQWADFTLGYSANYPRVLRFAPDIVWQLAVHPAIMRVAEEDAKRLAIEQVKLEQQAKARRERQLQAKASGNTDNSNKQGRRGGWGTAVRSAKRNKSIHGGRGSNAGRDPAH